MNFFASYAHHYVTTEFIFIGEFLCQLGTSCYQGNPYLHDTITVLRLTD